MPYQIVFVDLDGEFTSHTKALLTGSGVDAQHMSRTQVQDVRTSDVRTAYVSPANSLLYMDGGVDKAYSQAMFPGVQGCLQSTAQAYCRRNRLGQPYVPIGCALAVEVSAGKTWLIAAPTMWSPQDVSATNNAYHATRAALICADSIPGLQQLVIPAMCCGYGKMDPTQAALQVCAGVTRHFAAQEASRTRAFGFVHAGRNCLWIQATAEPVAEQPDNYVNADFRGLG